MEAESLFNASEQELIGIAMNLLSSVCDKASRRDNLGFNKADARKGHHLSVLPLDEWSEVDYAFCWAILFKYQNQLEGLFKVSIRDLYKEKLKGVRKKDINVVLQEVRNKIKDHVNDKHLVFATTERLTLVYNDKKYSVSVENAFQFIEATKLDGETSTTWEVDVKYCKGFYYIIKNLIGMSRVHFCTGAITRLEGGFSHEIPLADLLERGFDEMDLITLDTTLNDEFVSIQIKSRRDYSDIRRLTKSHYDKELLSHRALIAFQSDYKCVATLANAFKFKIRIDGKLSNIMGFVSYARGRLIKKGFFSYSINGRYIEIQDPQNLIALPLVTSKGVKATRTDGIIKIGLLSERGLSGLIKNLDNLSIQLKKDEVQSLRGEMRVDAEIKKPTVPENSIIIVDNKYNIKFKYDEKLVKLLKESIPSSQRQFNKETKCWLVDVDLLTEPFVSSLVKDHNFTNLNKEQ